jgi:hypothetical protein
MAVSTQTSDVVFQVSRDARGSGDADLKTLHGLVSMDIVNAAAAVNTGTFPNAVKSSSPSAGVGYATGAGGAITQITDATTGVTLNTVAGQVTTVALTTAAGAEERFTVTNSRVAATDVVVVGTTYAGAGTAAVTVVKTAAGAFDVVITNLHASAALNAALVVNFAVIKAVAA